MAQQKAEAGVLCLQGTSPVLLWTSASAFPPTVWTRWVRKARDERGDAGLRDYEPVSDWRLRFDVACDREVLLSKRCQLVLAPQAVATAALNSLRMLWVVAISAHSPFTFSMPRNRKRSSPLAPLI